MAIPTKEIWSKYMTEDNLRSEYTHRPSYMDFDYAKRPTEASFRLSVSRLKSISDAGKEWIVDERCKYASVGRYLGIYTSKYRNR